MGERKKHENRLQLLAETVHALAEGKLAYRELLELIVRRTAHMLDVFCSIRMLSEDGRWLNSVAYFHTDPDILHTLRSAAEAIALDTTAEHPAVTALKTGSSVLVDRVEPEHLRGMVAPEFLSQIALQHPKSFLFAPMQARGKLLGVLVLSRLGENSLALDANDQEFAQTLANQAAQAIANAQLLQNLQTQVTEREAAERALRRSEALRMIEIEAARANRFLDAIVENIPNMVFVKDAETLAFQRFNRAGEELLGADRKDLLGKTDYDFFPPEEAAFFQAKDRETLAANMLVDIAEEPIQTAGGMRWLHTKKVPILDDAGKPAYLLGISEDITARKAAEAELLLAKENAEAANRELEAFSYSVAHDLRAPLRSIDGFSAALLEDFSASLNDQGRKYLRYVRESAQQMSQLIDDLLMLSRVTRTELQRDNVDLSALAQQTVEKLRQMQPDRNVEVVVQPNLWGVGDRRLLAVIFDNLLGNAWKFTSKREDARIEVGGEPQNQTTAFFVRDNGAGFDMSLAHRLFNVFQRLHSSSEFEGTGVGLATVQRIVRRLGGRAWAQGEVGVGATIYFTLNERAQTP